MWLGQSPRLSLRVLVIPLSIAYFNEFFAGLPGFGHVVDATDESPVTLRSEEINRWITAMVRRSAQCDHFVFRYFADTSFIIYYSHSKNYWAIVNWAPL